MSVKGEARFRCKQLPDTSTTTESKSKDAVSGLEIPDFPEEVLIPQQQWDELFESAFDAIGDTCIDVFKEK